VEVVGHAGEVLGSRSQVRAVGETALVREGGDVFSARVRVGQTRLLRETRVERRVAERILLDVVQRRCGARTPPAPATAALTRPVLQGIAVRALSRDGLLVGSR
jgi:hypothetical protein